MGPPTPIQAAAWPHIAAGEHVLVTAPTGTGKTLAAFLWALDRLLAGHWEGGEVRVLYVSPLRALGNDVRRNLLAPLAELGPRFAAAGAPARPVRVLTRTGDTPQAERRRMLRHPPEVLISTPESLNILLASQAGRRLLGGLRTIILDEVHAVLDSKRGVHLITAVERLALAAGEVQRIALSATVRPADRIAHWVGGCRLGPGTGDGRLRPRAVTVVSDPTPKAYELLVDTPLGEPGALREPDALWNELAARLKRTVRGHRSTLVFANSKRTVEKVAHLLNAGEPVQLAYSHHGALSREIRAVVEERLKSGALRAIVATNSLELGIDVGAIDEVAMVQPPPSVTSTLQRLGRSGHRVGDTSRGRLYPLHPWALVEAAVLTRAALEGDIEPVRPIANALDVLAQVLVSMTVGTPWPIDELYDAVRTADPYRHLPRRQFDLVLEMLAGRYETSRLRHLRALVSIDRIDGVVAARPGAERLLFMAGGTIPDRGTFHLKVEGSGAPLGQLDEEFVWERSVGDTFSLGVQTWRINRITHNDVFVTAAAGPAAMAPFWRGEEQDRSSFLSDRIATFLELAEDRLGDEGFADELEHTYHLQPQAVTALLGFLREQRAHTGVLPHRHRVVVEHTAAAGGRADQRQLVLHTLWGGRLTRPFAYALTAAIGEATGVRPRIIHSDDSIILTVPAGADAPDPFALVEETRVEALLRASLEGTGTFGARFREAAGRALLLPRGGPRRRTPLWLNRQRAKELLAAVAPHGDFPLVLETWRTCLDDSFELDALRERLAEVREGRIEVRHVHTRTPSPFAAEVMWRQTNQLMYEDDRPAGAASRGTRADLVRELVLASRLRPRVARRLAVELEGKLQRTAAGYAPRSGADLVQWCKERLLIPGDEWSALLDAMARDHGADLGAELAAAAARLVTFEVPATPDLSGVAAVEELPMVAAALGWEVEDLGLRSILPGAGPPEAALQALRRLRSRTRHRREEATPTWFFGQWLAFYGPREIEWLATTVGAASTVVDEVLAELAEDEVVVLDEITDDAATVQVCDRENLERLLRMQRAAARPTFTPRAPDLLPLFLAQHQLLATADASIDDLQQALERLLGLPMPLAALETEVLPARLDPYLPAWLDALLAETDLQWFGCGRRRLAFALGEERRLFTGSRQGGGNESLDSLFPHPFGRFSLPELVRHTRASSTEVATRLWQHAWRGEVATDSFAPVRQALANRFRPPEDPSTTVEVGRRRPSFDRWRSTRPLSGNWYRLPPPTPPADALDEEEDARDRARLLLDRYGIVFHKLLQHELPPLRWGAVFRALRMLELAGEAVGGRFFDGVAGLQFMAPAALRRLQGGLPEDMVWWVDAVDPASPCGLGLEGLGISLPARRAGNHVVLHGRRVVVVSERHGRSLTIDAAPDHPRIADYLRFLRAALARAVEPAKAVTVERINGGPAGSSPYRAAFERLFQVTRTPSALRLSRRY